jgi:hypothetical protein
VAKQRLTPTLHFKKIFPTLHFENSRKARLYSIVPQAKDNFHIAVINDNVN